MQSKFLALSLFCIGVSGCATFDGLDGKSSFDCKAPDGVVCDSMTGVMANAKANNLPGQQVNRSSKTPEKGSEYTAVRSKPTSSVLPTMEYTGAPILRNPKTLRVWVAPWESADRTLFDQQFFYIVIDNWKWNIEHNSRRVRQAYAPSSASGYVASPSSVSAVSGNQDAYKMRVEGNSVVPDDDAIPLGGKGGESINPMPGKRDIDANVAKELKNMNVDISQFTKPLQNVGN